MIPVLIELAVRQRVAWGVISGVYQMAVPVDVVKHLRLIRLFMPLSSRDGIAVFAIKILIVLLAFGVYVIDDHLLVGER